MGLAPGEQRALKQIDEELCRSDPKLAALLTTFTRLTCHEDMPRREFLLGRRWRFRQLFPKAPPRIVSFIPVAMAAFALGLIVMIFAVFGHSSRPAGRLSCGVPSLASCELYGNQAGHAGAPGGTGQVMTKGEVISPGAGAR
jgi:hypothetical protein